MEVIKLIESKNRCLEKYLLLTSQLLEDLEKNDYSTLNTIEVQRESVLKALDLYDRRINDELKNLSPDQKNSDLITQVNLLEQTRTQLIQDILDQDKKIISLIELEKIRLLKESNESEKSSQILKKFKSSWVPEPGEKLDGTV